MPIQTFQIREDEFVEYKLKRMARQTVTNLLKSGGLVRSPQCQLCQEKHDTSAHHCDYGKPTEVIWLCDACHGKAHRADHDLNPKNIQQTTIPLVWNQKDCVNVTITLPVENFILLKKLAESKNTNISKLVRGCVLKEYPVDDNQLEFNLFEEKHDTSENPQKRVSLLEYNQERLHEQKPLQILPIRQKGVNVVKRMDKLSSVFVRHGENSSRSGRVSVAR